MAVRGGKRNPLHSALKAGYEAYRTHLADDGEDAAMSLGSVFDKSRDWIYAVLRGEISFRLIDLPAWIRATGDYTALEWVCAQVGVIPVRVPECSALGCTAATVREFAGYLEGVSSAHADGRVTQIEAAMIRKRGEAAIAAIHAEMAHCEKAASGPRSLADAERAV